jgi:hypothetical protein
MYKYRYRVMALVPRDVDYEGKSLTYYVQRRMVLFGFLPLWWRCIRSNGQVDSVHYAAMYTSEHGARRFIVQLRKADEHRRKTKDHIEISRWSDEDEAGRRQEEGQ